MAPLEKHVRLGNIAKKVIAECETTEKFATDPKVVKIYKDKPPKVEDKADTRDSTLAKPETIALPSDKHTPKKVTDADVKTSYTDLTNYVPAKIKRAEKSEIPTIDFNFDEKLLHAETEKELEDYFDGAHLVKLKEIMQKEFIAPKGSVSGVMDDKPSKFMFSKDQMPHKGEAVKPKPSVPEKHQQKIARDTLKMPDAMVGVMGGMNKQQARDILKKAGEKVDEKKAKLGSGARFKKVKRAAAASGARDPAAVAAAAGRAKYGQKKMTALSQKGKRDAKKEGTDSLTELHPETYASYLSKAKAAKKAGKRAKYPAEDPARELMYKAVDREYPYEPGDIDVRYGRPVSKIRDPETGHLRALRRDD